MKKEINFVKGKVTQKTFNNGGSIFNIWIPKEELNRIEGQNGINFSLKFGKDTGKPYMQVNDFKPQPKQEQEDNWNSDDREIGFNDF